MIKKFHIYVVSSESEKMRKLRLTDLLERSGLLENTTFIPSVHSSYINQNFLDSQGYRVYPDWYIKGHIMYGRQVREGELGCCIGHLRCWEAFIGSGYQYGLVLEDDVFWQEDILTEIMRFIEFNKTYKADLLYLGRIVMKPDMQTSFNTYQEYIDAEHEEWVNDHYTIPKFSYNLQSYIMSKKFVKTLLDLNPHKNLMTPDEIVPALYTDHPHPKIRQAFPKANIKALALTRNSEPNDPEVNKSVGITWQKSGEGITSSMLNFSEEYNG